MGNNADQLAVLPQTGQRFQRRLQGFFIERAEAFVQKQGIDPDVFAGHLRKPQRQRQTDDETFSSGQIFGRANLACLIIVDDVEFQRQRRIPD